MREQNRLEEITLIECEKLLREAGLPEKIREHCRAVSELAGKIADALNERGRALDAALCRRAGLLHDICRTEPDHDGRGGAYLEALGLCKEAEITRAHMGGGLCPGADPEAVSEKEIVFLADKLVSGAGRVTLEKRFEAALERYGGDAEAGGAIAEKYAQALSVQNKVEAALNKKLCDI